MTASTIRAVSWSADGMTLTIRVPAETPEAAAEAALLRIFFADTRPALAPETVTVSTDGEPDVTLVVDEWPDPVRFGISFVRTAGLTLIPAPSEAAESLAGAITAWVERLSSSEVTR